jgi:diphthamide synthase subunit DPH2
MSDRSDERADGQVPCKPINHPMSVLHSESASAGLHEQIVREKIPYVASFLIIDQFSRPYFEDRSGKIKESIDSSDIAKVTAALSLLDNFVTNMKELGGNFQMIVFEHISPDTWSGFSNFHLVESFKDGNALIPNDYE